MSKFAIIGDIHSSLPALQRVKQAILEQSPDATIVCNGDVYECIISKKQLPVKHRLAPEQVYFTSAAFEDLLDFPSVLGNQEERILEVVQPHTKRDELANWKREWPLTKDATVIHGHQWQWGGNPWTLQHADTTARLTFFGHSHQAALNGKAISYDVPYDVSQGSFLINVGAVIETMEWVSFDSRAQTVTFHRLLRHAK